MEFVKCLGHPEEFYNLLRFQMGGRQKVIPKMDQDSLSSSLKTCYKYLNQTSRSFAAVIQALDGEMRHAVCIFYLVLRALDTLEDDMTISVERKVPLLHNFHSYLYEPDWRFTESKEKDRQVLEDFPTVAGLAGRGRAHEWWGGRQLARVPGGKCKTSSLRAV
ncbi:squalene synthase isoform X2 [Physeter macrocephalus]|uniref:Squalene synthase isoform X2 n=1 Tax=Physeter macrocephalus TaxID=9755 RepID=A0A455BM31_PHYMC|nr:squalene synthase isoform X2 [Physeter catodon]|eukprot:XP_028350045.1 squalene synthase isoform X2 [Physeter catodon]